MHLAPSKAKVSHTPVTSISLLRIHTIHMPEMKPGEAILEDDCASDEEEVERPSKLVKTA